MYERIIQRQMTPSETSLRIFILFRILTNIQRPKKWTSFPILHIRCILCIFAPVNFLQVHKNSWHFLERYIPRGEILQEASVSFAYGRECSGSVYVCAPRFRDARENRLDTTYNRSRCLEARNSIDDQQITNVFHNCRERNT